METTDYVSYELAVKLKAAGFDEPCAAFYEHIDGKMYFSVDGNEDWNSGVDYLRRYFINQTLNAEGYIIPGDYETETPEHGKVKYSIWTERSNYCEALTRKPVVDKMLDMMIDDANKVCEAHRKVLSYQLLLASPAMIDGEIKINDNHGI